MCRSSDGHNQDPNAGEFVSLGWSARLLSNDNQERRRVGFVERLVSTSCRLGHIRFNTFGIAAQLPIMDLEMYDARSIRARHADRVGFVGQARQRGEDVALDPSAKRPLTLGGHVVAGVLAGWTVCSFITPIELIKAKLQLQTTGPRLYTGPIDVIQQIVRHQGVTGLYHALPGTLLFRTSFGAMFGSYEILMRAFRNIDESSKWKVSEPTANFLAGGTASNAFWITAFPFDAVKNRMMADSITNPKYPTWMSAARSIWLEGGMRAYYRGFVPCLLRAFPTVRLSPRSRHCITALTPSKTERISIVRMGKYDETAQSRRIAKVSSERT